MSNPEKKYFYKEVENSFEAFKAFSASLNPLFFSDEMRDKMRDLAEIDWLELSDDLNIIPDKLTVEQKEEIALNNRTDLEEKLKLFHDFETGVKQLNLCVENFDNTLQKMQTVINNSVYHLPNLNYRINPANHICPIPFPLTYKELYWAFTFLNLEEIRQVLATQTPNTIDRLLYAFPLGLDRFVEAIEDSDYFSATGLREMLGYAIEKVDPSHDFMLKQGMENKSIFEVAIEDALNDGNLPMDIKDELNLLIEQPRDGETLELFNKINYFFGALMYKLALSLYNSKYLSIFDKRSINELYEEYRKVNPTCLKLEKNTCVNFSDRFYEQAVSLNDKWILDNIHQRMSQNSIVEVDSEVETSESAAISKDNRRLPFSNRMVGNKSGSIYSNYHASIFEELYKVYNHFENMTLPEWLYFWGACDKRPNSYNPPYYWTGDEAFMKAFLRILYTPQPKVVRKILRFAPDREVGIKEHDWGINKDSVAYIDIQAAIQRIVKDIANVNFDSL